MIADEDILALADREKQQLNVFDGSTVKSLWQQQVNQNLAVLFLIPHPIYVVLGTKLCILVASSSNTTSNAIRASELLLQNGPGVCTISYCCKVKSIYSVVGESANRNHDCTWCTTVAPQSTTGVQRFQYTSNQYTVFFLHIAFVHNLKSELEMQNIILKGFLTVPPMDFCIPLFNADQLV